MGTPCAECSEKVRRGASQVVCGSSRCHVYFNCVSSTRLQVDYLHQLVNCRCMFCISRQVSVSNHPGAEPWLVKQYQRFKQGHLFTLRWNASCIIREVAALETVMASLQVDFAAGGRRYRQKSLHVEVDTSGRCVHPGNQTFAKGQNTST